MKKCLKKGGLILIDDAYIEDTSEFSHPAMLKRTELLNLISQAEMKIADELIANEQIAEHEQEFDFVEQRCGELIKKFPEKKSLFESYIQKQKEEYDVLDTKTIGLTMAIKEKS